MDRLNESSGLMIVELGGLTVREEDYGGMWSLSRERVNGELLTVTVVVGWSLPSQSWQGSPRARPSMPSLL